MLERCLLGPDSTTPHAMVLRLDNDYITDLVVARGEFG
jgi:hypothetical protein